MTAGNRREPAGAVRKESRKSRQTRRRREELRREISFLAALVSLAVIAIVAFIVVTAQQHPRVAGPSRPIGGIPCQASQGNYHEHAHLTILDSGRALSIPGTIGHGSFGCFYWLHTHDSDPSGLIHLEAPHRIVPSLGTFFDIWGQPLSRQRVWMLSVKSDQAMRVYVNQRLYIGDPRLIRLLPHTSVTIEVGPPFPKPKKYKFGPGY